MFDLIASIASKDPFFLSYLAVNPDKAQTIIKDTLTNPDFTLTIKGPDETFDKLKTASYHPCGLNGHQIDNKNVQYIISQSNTTLPFEQVKNVYLLYDRDISQTIQDLKVS